VHGRGLLRAGLLVSASCNDCHASHEVFPNDDPRSPLFRESVPETCGTCHQGVLSQYRESIHGGLLAEGDPNVPACTTCHTTHTPPPAVEAGFRAAAVAECGNCHADKLDTYRGTLHGKANELGYADIAACSSCHTAHHNLPASDPGSSIALQNLVATCSSCHPGANESFTRYRVHADPTDAEQYPLLFFIYFGMIGLLSATMVGATAHTALWYRRLRQQQRETGASYRREEYWHPSGAREYVRFNLFNRILHMLVMSSFILLVATGIPLHFSDSPWAASLMGFFGGFRAAGWVHRFGAIIMFVYVFLHLGYLVYLKAAKGQRGILFGPDSLMPRRRDLTDFIGQMKWFMGRGPQPEFGRWTYWEKFDYLADAWGVIVFGSTGLILWYPVLFTRWLPGWVINVAFIVHGIEALLALSFIFTVHFFNAHLRPGKFPLDPVFLTGRITVEELKEERPLEYRRLVESERLNDHLTEPSTPLTLHYARVIGYTALTVGLTLVAIVFVSLLLRLLL
jgi:cytochrome b subunit of formate dehydrogenase